MDVDDIAFSSSLFSDKVDNTDGLNQLQMDAIGCMVQGSFLTYMYSVGRHSRRSSSSTHLLSIGERLPATQHCDNSSIVTTITTNNWQNCDKIPHQIVIPLHSITLAAIYLLVVLCFVNNAPNRPVELKVNLDKICTKLENGSFEAEYLI